MHPNGTAASITGTVAERYAYTPYGQATAYDANWSNPASPTEDGPLYCGYFFDAESGLFQVRNRYYDSCLSRFINRDPIGYEGSPWNLYEYVLSNPFRFIDPTGLEGGAGTISQAQLDYAKSKCTGNCGLGNPLTSIKVGMQKLGNFLIRKGATSSTESDLVDKMHDAYYKANEFATAAIKELNLKDTVRNHAALRHCFASAKYAATLGCGCAGCLGHYREEYQLLEQGQSAETTERTDWNNSMGRGVAGCMGTGNTIGNGDRFGDPHHDGPVSDDEISQGCKDMFLSGLLDLGGKTGPRRPGDPPWRKQCPKVYPVPFPRIETK